MPFGSLKPICFRCKIEESTIWRKVQIGDDKNGDGSSSKEEIICNDCSIRLKRTRVYLNSPEKLSSTKLDDDKEQEINLDGGSSSTNKNDLKDTQSSSNQSKMLTRKSTRNKRGSNRLNLNNRNQSSSKGKGRRHIFKRNVYKSPSSVCCPMTRESVYHNGVKYQVGDIVSMIDADDGTTYFAQIKGFLQDQFCEKSAAITWLIPNSNKNFKPIGEFHPADYVLGPEEEYPRKLDCMEFVCRSPSDYYKSSNSPYLTARHSAKPEVGFILTTWENTLGSISIFNKENDNQDELEEMIEFR